MRISDWSSDVCSSDLVGRPPEPIRAVAPSEPQGQGSPERPHGRPRDAPDGDGGPARGRPQDDSERGRARGGPHAPGRPDRQRVVEGKSVSVRVDIGGRRIIKKKKKRKKFRIEI